MADQRLDCSCADDADHRRAVDLLGARVDRADPVLRSVSVPTDGAAARIRRLLDEIDPGGGSITRFAVHTATLDDVFLALTGHTTTGPTTTGPRTEPAHV